jgi:hypothetical protein
MWDIQQLADYRPGSGPGTPCMSSRSTPALVAIRLWRQFTRTSYERLMCNSCWTIRCEGRAKMPPPPPPTLTYSRAPSVNWWPKWADNIADRWIEHRQRTPGVGATGWSLNWILRYAQYMMHGVTADEVCGQSWLTVRTVHDRGNYKTRSQMQNSVRDLRGS